MAISRTATTAPGRSRREERRERGLELRRSDVVAAAATEFSEHGFDGAQMSAIAARAEVALGTLYSLFESKEQLFQAVIETSAEAVRDSVQAEVLAVSGSRERLLHLIDAAFERFQSEPVFFRIYAQSTQGWPARIRAAMGESAQAHFADFLGWVVGLARDAAADGALRGIDPEAFGMALMGTLVNVTSAITSGTTARSADDFADDVRTLFEQLLAPEPAR
jgi:AcrR family transcriptional regulator